MLKERPILFHVYEPPTELDDSFPFEGLTVTSFYSCLWETGYNTTGSFTLEVKATEKNIAGLAIGNFVTCSRFDGTMVIRSAEISDNHLTVSGFEAIYVFTERVNITGIPAGTSFKTGIENMWDKYVNDDNRRYPGIETEISWDDESEGEYANSFSSSSTYAGGTMTDTMQSLCNEFSWGVKLAFGDGESNGGPGKLKLSFYYGGQNPTDNDDDSKYDMYRLSDLTGSLSSPVYEADDLDYRNVGYAIDYYDYESEMEYADSSIYVDDLEYIMTNDITGGWDSTGKVGWAVATDSNEKYAGWDRREIAESSSTGPGSYDGWFYWIAALGETAANATAGLTSKTIQYSFNLSLYQIDNMPELGEYCEIVLDAYGVETQARLTVISYEVTSTKITTTLTFGDATFKNI